MTPADRLALMIEYAVGRFGLTACAVLMLVYLVDRLLPRRPNR